MTVKACVAIVYIIGFLVAPFVWSLIDGWPLAKPRIDGLDGSATFFIALFWPVFLVIFGLYCWWVFCSFAGTKAHEAIKCKIERMASDDNPDRRRVTE